jgi:hypothetical protein
MVSDFWDDRGVILVNFLTIGTTVTSNVCIETQKKSLNARFNQVLPTRQCLKCCVYVTKLCHHMFWMEGVVAATLQS